MTTGTTDSRRLPGTCAAWLLRLLPLAVLALALLIAPTQLALADDPPPGSGFGSPPVPGGNPGGAQPQPQPVPLQPPVRYTGAAGVSAVRTDAADGLPLSPISVYGSLLIMFGLETFNGEPGFSAPTAFGQSIGIEAGLSLNFTKTVRLTAVIFRLELINSVFHFTNPDDGIDGTAAILGGRATFGLMMDIGPVNVALRYGERAYWSNHTVGSGSFSVYGNDHNRDVFDLAVGWNAFGFGFVGATFEWPINSPSSKFGIWLDLAIRFYIP